MSRYRSVPPTTLYVRNISDRFRFDDLRRLFLKFGKIADVTIPQDYYSGLPKGYCFIEYDDYRDAEEAQYRLDRLIIFGREIEIEFARGDRKSAGQMRTRDKDRRSDYEKRKRSNTRSRSPKKSSEGTILLRSRSRRARSANGAKSFSVDDRYRSISRPRSPTRRSGSCAVFKVLTCT